MSLAILFHFLCTQHVSDINISKIRILRLCYWITTSVVLFCKDGGVSVSAHLWCLVLCVWCDVLCVVCVVWCALSLCCGRYVYFQWYRPFSFMLCDHCVLLCVVSFTGWLVIWCVVNVLCYIYLRLHIQSTWHETHNTKHHKLTLTLNTPSLQNKTADVVIQQHSRKLLMMDILMSETCWVHKKCNKIANAIKLVFSILQLSV